MLTVRLILATLATLSTSGHSETSKKSPETLTIFAAASLTNVLPQVTRSWEQKSGHVVIANFDASSRLAKQIEQGAPADLFISADAQWVEYLSAKNKLKSGSRRDLLGNELVLVVPVTSPFKLEVRADKLDFTGLSKLAIAGENVPAGRYAKAVLQSIGAWEAVSAKIVRGDHVRTVLSWVATGDVSAAIVYRTDALSLPDRVRIAAVFREKDHPQILYPAAIVERTKNSALSAQFIDFCHNQEAVEIFQKAGFKVVPGA